MTMSLGAWVPLKMTFTGSFALSAAMARTTARLCFSASQVLTITVRLLLTSSVCVDGSSKYVSHPSCRSWIKGIQHLVWLA